eukprot:c5698_g1_i1.p1 GENE.c5698_g1_i1~~c5698_g1_i1.p1  ORF type:complete len:1249 (-),score=337.86 c5698_g1_i1:383-4129(-)
MQVKVNAASVVLLESSKVQAIPVVSFTASALDLALAHTALSPATPPIKSKDKSLKQTNEIKYAIEGSVEVGVGVFSGSEGKWDDLVSRTKVRVTGELLQVHGYVGRMGVQCEQVMVVQLHQNETAAVLSVASHMHSVLAQSAVAMMFVPKTLPFHPFWILNDNTGHDLIITPTGPNAPRDLQQVVICPSSSPVPLPFEMTSWVLDDASLTSRVNQVNICFSGSGWGNHTVSVHDECSLDLTMMRPQSDAVRVVWGVELRAGSRFLSLRSPVSFANHTDTRLEVEVQTNGQDAAVMPLAPQSSCAVAIMQAKPTRARFRVAAVLGHTNDISHKDKDRRGRRRSAKEVHMDSHAQPTHRWSDWAILDHVGTRSGSATLVVCSAPLPSNSISSSASTSTAPSANPFTMVVMRAARNPFIFNVAPPLTLYNSLPIGLHVMLFAVSITVAQVGEVPRAVPANTLDPMLLTPAATVHPVFVTVGPSSHLHVTSLPPCSHYAMSVRDARCPALPHLGWQPACPTLLLPFVTTSTARLEVRKRRTGVGLVSVQGMQEPPLVRVSVSPDNAGVTLSVDYCVYDQSLTALRITTTSGHTLTTPLHCTRFVLPQSRDPVSSIVSPSNPSDPACNLYLICEPQQATASHDKDGMLFVSVLSTGDAPKIPLSVHALGIVHTLDLSPTLSLLGYCRVLSAAQCPVRVIVLVPPVMLHNHTDMPLAFQANAGSSISASPSSPPSLSPMCLVAPLESLGITHCGAVASAVSLQLRHKSATHWSAAFAPASALSASVVVLVPIGRSSQAYLHVTSDVTVAGQTVFVVDSAASTSSVSVENNTPVGVVIQVGSDVVSVGAGAKVLVSLPHQPPTPRGVTIALDLKGARSELLVLDRLPHVFDHVLTLSAGNMYALYTTRNRCQVLALFLKQSLTSAVAPTVSLGAGARSLAVSLLMPGLELRVSHSVSQPLALVRLDGVAVDVITSASDIGLTLSLANCAAENLVTQNAKYKEALVVTAGSTTAPRDTPPFLTCSLRMLRGSANHITVIPTFSLMVGEVGVCIDTQLVSGVRAFVAVLTAGRTSSLTHISFLTHTMFLRAGTALAPASPAASSAFVVRSAAPATLLFVETLEIGPLRANIRYSGSANELMGGGGQGAVASLVLTAVSSLKDIHVRLQGVTMKHTLSTPSALGSSLAVTYTRMLRSLPQVLSALANVDAIIEAEAVQDINQAADSVVNAAQSLVAGIGESSLFQGVSSWFTDSPSAP